MPLGLSPDVTPWGIVTVVVFLVLFGWLVPRRSWLDMRDDRDAWREAAQISENARHEVIGLLKETAEGVRVVVAFVEKTGIQGAQGPGPPT